MVKKKEKPREVIPSWKVWRKFRLAFFFAALFAFIDLILFAFYGTLNPIGWLYGVVFAAIVVLLMMYESNR